jgi:hypothetical protein
MALIQLQLRVWLIAARPVPRHHRVHSSFTTWLRRLPFVCSEAAGHIRPQRVDLCRSGTDREPSARSDTLARSGRSVVASVCCSALRSRAAMNSPSERPAFGLRAASTRAQWPHSASLPNYTRRSRSRSQSVIRSILDAIPHWTATTRTLSWVLSGDALRDFGD